MLGMPLFSDAIWLHRLGHVVMGAAVQLTAPGFGCASAPLLEEKRDFGSFALVSEVCDPFRVHGTCARPALAAGDQPVDVLKVQVFKRPQQRFGAYETNPRVD